MRVLVACEFSGVVRDAFLARGHDAISIDLLPTESPGPHIEGDVRELMEWDYDLMIAHPPCTYLAVSGARWFKGRQQEQAEALEFVRWLMDAPVPRIAIENPISVISTRVRKPTQIIQPWQFGHPEVKATCLWLQGLPALVPTDVVDGRQARVHREPPGPDRWKNRSRTRKPESRQEWQRNGDDHLLRVPREAKRKGTLSWLRPHSLRRGREVSCGYPGARSAVASVTGAAGVGMPMPPPNW